jgi:hypothetical protein
LIECLRSMAIQRIIVCEVQVPFVHGGAEYLVRTLHQQLRVHGYQASSSAFRSSGRRSAKSSLTQPRGG